MLTKRCRFCKKKGKIQDSNLKKEIYDYLNRENLKDEIIKIEGNQVLEDAVYQIYHPDDDEVLVKVCECNDGGYCHSLCY